MREGKQEEGGRGGGEKERESGPRVGRTMVICLEMKGAGTGRGHMWRRD